MDIFSWKDPLTWPKFLGKNEALDLNIDEDLMWQFYNNYDYIRVYHAARPTDLNLYYKNGLKVSNYRELEKEFSRNMKTNFDIDITKEHLDLARKEIGEFHNGRLFVVLDDTDLLNHAGHYAIYGSEYICAIANRIFHKFKVGGSRYLKEIGTPTVFELLLGINHISEYDLKQLVCQVNNYIHYDEIALNIDFTIELQRSLDGSSIVQHYHPKRVTDLFERGLA
ncbi:hypothetical protein [Teredinibacter haidensis]|uniref:hypothetical protein n=1 Tax=Teredinibacter haidensis TaxID=2731755 RepID=UPI000948E06E|nr:hypothetical protein [Teredinibacter haidensis]